LRRVMDARHTAVMGDAAKVIHWNGTDTPEELRSLPPGSYRVVPVESDDGFELTPELEAKIEAGIRSAREGRVVSLEEADARLRATIAAARARVR